MPDTQTIETTNAHEDDLRGRRGDEDDGSAARRAAAIEAAYILEAIRK